MLEKSENIEQFINKITNINFKWLILLFILVFVIREWLETVVFYGSQPLFETDILNALSMYIFHFISYICAVLFFSISISIITHFNFVKTTKLVLFFFPLILTSVLLDGLLFHNPTKYDFITGSPIELIQKILFFFIKGSNAQPLGFRIEIFLLFLISFLFFLYKTRNILFSIFSVICFYFSFMAIMAIEIPGNNYFPYYIIYLIALMVLGCMLWYSKNKNQFFGIARNVRPLRTFCFLLICLAGFLLGGTPINSLNLLNLIASLTIVFLCWQFGVLANDLTDIKIDRITSPERPLIRNIIDRNQLFLLLFIIAVCALILSFCLFRLEIILLAIFALFICIPYSFPPLRLKRFLFSTIFSASETALFFLIGFFSAGGMPNISILQIVLAIIICGTLGFNVKDIKDFKGDKNAKINTLPVLLGYEKGKIAIGFLLLLVYLLFPLIISAYELLPFCALFGILSFFLTIRKKFDEKPILLIFLVFLVLINISIWIKYF